MSEFTKLTRGSEGQVRREVLAFGPFHLDVAQMLLRQRGQRVRLSAGLTRLLILFATRPGELLTREEVAACLWRDAQHVDFISGINTAVRRLRAILGDGATEPTYIETVIGMGYRFIAEVQVELSGSQSATAEVEVEPLKSQSATASLVCDDSALTGAKSEPARILTHHVLPSTSVAPKNEMCIESREPEHPARKWSETLPGVPVAQQKGTFTSRTWALICGSVLLATFVVLGNLHSVRPHADAPPQRFQRVAQATFVPSDDQVQAAALSHDGRLLAFSDSRGLSTRLLDRQVSRRLAIPTDLASIKRLVWFRGDHMLLVSGSMSSGGSQVWETPLNGQSSRLLLADAADAYISHDGARLAFTRQNSSELWVANSDGTKQRILLRGDERRSFLQPLWSADDSSVQCQVRSIPQDSRDLSQSSDYDWAFDTFSVVNGTLLGEYMGLGIHSAAMLAKGRLYFNAAAPVHAGSRLTVYAVNTDLHTGRLLGTPEPVATPVGERLTDLSASDDGEELGFILHRRNAQVHTATVLTGGTRLSNVRTLVHPAPDNFPQAWMPKQDAVIFESDDLDKYALYTQSLNGSPAVLFARSVGGAVLPQVTPDAKWVLFENLSGFHPDSIYRVPIEGGTELYEVPTHGKVGEFKCSVSSKGRCVLRNKEGPFFVFYELRPLTGDGPELGKVRWVQNALGGWSLSPDGEVVALPINKDGQPFIELVTLDSGAMSTTRTIRIQERWAITGATWAPDSRGFYVEGRDDQGYSLSFVDLRGSPFLLRQSAAPIWGVPSRDGAKLAFPELDPSTNAWIARR